MSVDSAAVAKEWQTEKAYRINNGDDDVLQVLLRKYALVG